MKRRSAAIAVTIIVAVAGCGGSSGLSRQQYVTNACAAFWYMLHNPSTVSTDIALMQDNVIHAANSTLLYDVGVVAGDAEPGAQVSTGDIRAHLLTMEQDCNQAGYPRTDW